MTMANEAAYEYKHLECPQSWVNAVLRQNSIFWWELVATQVVVSKESHLESGGIFDPDTIYSVTTTERFATVDLRRRKNLPNLNSILNSEYQYFEKSGQLINLGCSPLDDYNSPPPEKGIGCLGVFLYILYIFPGILYSKKVKSDNEKRLLEYRQLKSELDSLLVSYRQFLNL